MKKIKLRLFTPIVCLMILFSCQTADELIPTSGNEVTAISLILPDGRKVDADLKGLIDNVINIEVEGKITTDMSKLRMALSVPNNATIESDVTMGTYMDFTKPVQFDVIGANGERRTYTVNATLLATQIEIEELWRKTGSEINFIKDNNRSIGISGDYLVIHERFANGANKYYNLETGVEAGVLLNEGVDMGSVGALHMISDDAGNIISSPFIPGAGNEFRVYWWSGVNAIPKLLLTWMSDAPGNIGRKLYVKGDMNKLAYLYATVSTKNMFLRWEIKNGEVTSTTPDVIEFNHPNNGWGINGKVVPVSVGKNSDYFINTQYQAGVTLMNGGDNSVIYNSEKHIYNVFEQWLASPWGSAHAFDYVDIKGAQYIFMIEQNTVNWMSSVFNVRKVIKEPRTISNVSELVHTRSYNSWLDFPLDPAFDGSNGNAVGEVKAFVYEDRNYAIVAFMSTNGGVKVWKVSLA